MQRAGKVAERSLKLNLDAANYYLAFKARSINAVSACETIEKLVSEQQKSKIFQNCFPDHWQRSNTSRFKQGFYQNYSERSNELFQLVNEHRFPMLSGWNEDSETDFEEFGIYSENIDFCCDEIEYEYLRISYVVALLFLSQDEEIWEYLYQNLHIKQKDFPKINGYSDQRIWSLEKTNRQGLYINIWEIVDHSTGNPWLDTSNCQYSESYSWDEKTIEFLTKSYKESQQILEQTCFLDELIESNPTIVLDEMIELWNTGKISNPKTLPETTCDLVNSP